MIYIKYINFFKSVKIEQNLMFHCIMSDSTEKKISFVIGVRPEEIYSITKYLFEFQCIK